MLQLIQHSVNLRLCFCVCECVCGRTVKCPAISNILVCQLEFCLSSGCHTAPVTRPRRPGTPSPQLASLICPMQIQPGSIVTWISCTRVLYLSIRTARFPRSSQARRLCATNAYQKFVTCQKLRPFFSHTYCMKVHCKPFAPLKRLFWRDRRDFEKKFNSIFETLGFLAYM